jgi:hypothetical protein
MPDRDKLSEFTAWCAKHIAGDEKGQAQIFLDRLFQAFGQPGCLDVRGVTKFRVRKPVMPPGVPKNYPDAKKLVTGACIRPAAVTR